MTQQGFKSTFFPFIQSIPLSLSPVMELKTLSLIKEISPSSLWGRQIFGHQTLGISETDRWLYHSKYLTVASTPSNSFRRICQLGKWLSLAVRPFLWLFNVSRLILWGLGTLWILILHWSLIMKKVGIFEKIES